MSNWNHRGWQAFNIIVKEGAESSNLQNLRLLGEENSQLRSLDEICSAAISAFSERVLGHIQPALIVHKCAASRLEALVRGVAAACAEIRRESAPEPRGWKDFDALLDSRGSPVKKFVARYLRKILAEISPNEGPGFDAPEDVCAASALEMCRVVSFFFSSDISRPRLEKLLYNTLARFIAHMERAASVSAARSA